MWPSSKFIITIYVNTLKFYLIIRNIVLVSVLVDKSRLRGELQEVSVKYINCVFL